ncbi:MAG: hypothetical protein IT367_08360 [Candidatus Hydrogenedentes bacterium]|nr:hypothetical protein [Candidatus Hydrogenedentota bacterium]
MSKFEPDWQIPYVPVFDGRIRTHIDHKSRTIFLTPEAGLAYLAPPPPRELDGKLYTYVVNPPDTRVPLRYKTFYENRNQEQPLDLLIRCFMPMLWLSYKSKNTFLPIHGITRSGDNPLEKCIPGLRTAAEYAISRGQLKSSCKTKKPYGVTPSNFIKWLSESKYEFAGDSWIKPFLKIWLAVIQDDMEGPFSSDGRGNPLSDEEASNNESICEAWAAYKQKFGSKPRRKIFCQTFRLPTGEAVTLADVRKALGWKYTKEKRARLKKTE